MKQKNNTTKVLRLLGFAVFGGFLGYMLGRMGGSALPASTLSLGAKLAALILIIPAFLVVVAWHEGGHAVAGIGVGFDFKLYVVGPFMWEKQSSGWQFKWNKNINTAGGLVLCLPVDSDHLIRRFSVFAAGGPIASLILTFLAYGSYAVLPKSNAGLEILGLFFLLTALMSIVIFFVTSIPLHVGGFYTDGARILRLQKGGDVARFEILMLKIIADTTSGVRPKLLKIKEIEEAQVIAERLNEPFKVYLHSFLYQAAFDNNEVEEAEKHLLNYLNEAENIPEGIRNGVWLEAAFFYAYAKKDLAKAEAFWQQYRPAPLIPKAQILATETALAFLKNDSETALSKAEAALQELPNMMDKGVSVALKDKLIALKSAAQKQA